MNTQDIHRANLSGKPLCGSLSGRVSTSGVVVTCSKCRQASTPNRAAQIESLEKAAKLYQDTHSN